MKTISIQTEYIALGQFLKLADCIATGGQAKSFLQETEITVNGAPENRRGRKLYAGDLVRVAGCGDFRVERN
ncbi:MAG: S4 domain-containing protein YaaA [Paenibacillaceae bacterium]|uniref:S4 domain-containing protein YaaA n=1 Tax=Paenibacillus cymbidii TaxID=1639034 RepID=UPI00107FEA42|nr:S4 domain-containing protein YaaA [Paenibacillus cymbidii]MBO9608775.1 S4 domain-containing protein YaaA [Paenibacillaceae bacterium]